MQMLSATLRSGISDSSWKMQAMPAATASCGCAKRRSLPLQHDAALVGLHHAGHDLDQRRLAGAVLAEQRVDAPRGAGEARALERAHAAIALGDVDQPQDRIQRCRDRQLFFSSFAMMSVAFRFTPQGGKSLVVKKLSVSLGK